MAGESKKKKKSLDYTRKINAQDPVKLLITEFDTIRKKVQNSTFLGLIRLVSEKSGH